MIHLDYDNVGVNFTAGVSKYIPWDEFVELDKLTQERKLTEIYTKHPNFFYDLEPIDEYRKLIDLCEASGERWSVLTSIGTAHPDARLVARCKELSLWKHFGVERNKIIFTSTSQDKVLYAKPTSVLVDDYHRNVTAFKEAGGMGVLVPSVNYSAYNVMSEVEVLLDSRSILQVF